jgi:putative flippase GtrA
MITFSVLIATTGESDKKRRVKHESYLARFVKSHRSGLILTTPVIEMLVSPAADYHPHIGAVLAAFIWLVIVAAANYMASRELMCWSCCH